MHKITGYDIDMNEETAVISLTVSLPRSEVRQRIDRMPRSVDAQKHPEIGCLTLLASEVVSDVLRRHNL